MKAKLFLFMAMLCAAPAARAGYYLNCDKVCAQCPYVCDCDEGRQTYSCEPAFTPGFQAPPPVPTCRRGDRQCVGVPAGNECRAMGLNGQTYVGSCWSANGDDSCQCAP